jgi:5-methylcytosine-specific restriction endonuclease McrA
MPTMPKRVHSIKEYNPRKEKNNWLKDQGDLKFYNTQAWRKLSIAYKMTNPVCEVEQCTQPSYYTDHIKPVSEGGDKWDTNNFQALCKSCNASKTAKQSKR